MRLSSFALVALLVAPLSLAGAHTWDVNEVFVNADGTIWFVELLETGGGNGETNVGNRVVASLGTGGSFTICCNVTAPTGNRHLLFANQAFADLPGAPAPDQIVAMDAFFAIAGDTVRYTPYDDLTWGSPLPTDGINSLNEGAGIAVNSPTNYAGESGSVDASGGGAGSGEVALTMNKLAGGSVELSWGASCEAGDDVAGVYSGTLAALPAYDHSSLVCDLSGQSHAFSPIAGDRYYLVVPAGADSEGSYGADAGGTPRPAAAAACKAQAISCPP